MKKLILLFFFALLLGCSHESVNVQNYVESNFTTEFIDSFGTPDANHYWGFIRSSTRASDPNSSTWAWRPEDITQDEVDAVLKVFNEVGDESYTSLVDWNRFFVQQVYKGTKHYTAGNGGDVIGSDHMDWLCTVADQKVEVISWWPYEEKVVSCPSYDDHIFDFNGGNSNDYGGRMLMVNSNTNKFGYHNSEDSKVHYNFRMEKINGNYYVGFDFYGDGQNPNQQIERDYIYNDWIIKIIPAYSKIIIAEDLGVEDSDFDYNDVVFGVDGDVVTLLAAGGTLPLYIDDNEVHAKFGVPVTTMVNTINFYEYPPVQFKIGNYTLQNIPIKVEGKAGMYTIPWFKGKPSAKICVDHGFIWSKERVPIQNTYPLFKEYVKDQTIKFW